MQVREARDAARDAAGLLQELQRFVQDEGADGDWRAWVSSHVAYSGGCAKAASACWQLLTTVLTTAVVMGTLNQAPPALHMSELDDSRQDKPYILAWPAHYIRQPQGV